MPQFYLRNFASKTGQVVLVHRDDLSRAHPTAVRKACAEVGFYRVDPGAYEPDQGSEPIDPEMIEQHLSQFERSAAPGIYKLVRTGLADLTREDWYHLINFTALQTVRGNRFREDMNAAGTHALRVHLGETVTDERIRNWLEEDGRSATTADISTFREDLLGPHGPRLVAARETLIRESLTLALDRLGARLAHMTWSVVEADSAHVLTGDEPVCWWAPGEGPVGFGSAQVVWLPVSRRRILQLRDRTVTSESLGLPDPATPASRDALVRFINAEVATQAHRWIVHHPDDRPLDDLDLGPRTAWADELVSVEENGDNRRELWIHRRLPVPPQQSAPTADKEPDLST